MKKLEKMGRPSFMDMKRLRPERKIYERKIYDWRDEVIENKFIDWTILCDCDFTNAIFRNCSIEYVVFVDCITDNMVFDSCSFMNITFIKTGCGKYIPENVIGLPEVPFVPALEERIYQAIQVAENKGDKPALCMMRWHTTYLDSERNACGTTHCLAGWAVHLAGENGYALEKAFTAKIAGELIYQKSCGFVPDFYATDQKALCDLRYRLGITVPKAEK